MTVWLVIAVPLVMMLFPLIMERVESRLQSASVKETDVMELLEKPQPNEVRALYGHGIGKALELFRLRRLGGKATKFRPRKSKD